LTGDARIESYRERLEEFEETLNRELYLYYSGQKKQLEACSLYLDYSDFFSLEQIQEAKAELYQKEVSSSRLKSTRKIIGYLMDQHLDLQTIQLTQEIEQFEAKEGAVWEGHEIPLSSIPPMLYRESDANTRRRLYETYTGAFHKSELKINKLAQLRAAAVGLGFKTYTEAREHISGVDYRLLLDSFDAAMNGLEDIFKNQFHNSVEMSLGIPYQEAGCWDVPHWLKKNDEENVFSEMGLLPVVNAAIEALGIQPEHPDAVLPETARETLKYGKPFCIPIRIPQEIRIVIFPGCGFLKYASLLHENGHAHGFAWTNASLPAEQRIWGDRALSEAYGFLFESPMRDPYWLDRMLSLNNRANFMRFQSLFRLFLMRRSAARLRFTLELHETESIESIPGLFAETMRSYTGLRYPPESWLAELSDGFESADYLRGCILEAMLREYLCSKYGKIWFLNRSAGRFLKEIWETGTMYRADELCREIGFPNLDPQILTEDLLGGLQS
jgi:hypothetical protein